MVRYIRSYMLISMFSMITACSFKEGKHSCEPTSTSLDALQPHDTKQVEPWITIWVHGTQPSLETSHTTGVRASIKKLAEKIFYCKQGLYPIEDQSEKNRHYTIAKLLAKQDPLHFSEQHFYTFGWSGKLSFEARKEAAKNLYHDLTELVERYTKQTGKRPHIRMITHSHGGNVALNLAAAEQEYKKNIVVDELVLLACPVQKETSSFVHTCIFPKIHSFYSSLDFIQRLDPQGLYKHKKEKTPLFSQQIFPTCSKVTQAKVTFGNRGILHVEFLSDRFLHALPDLLKILDTSHQGKPLTISISPHTVTVCLEDTIHQ